jgi:hypothetical protein
MDRFQDENGRLTASDTRSWLLTAWHSNSSSLTDSSQQAAGGVNGPAVAQDGRTDARERRPDDPGTGHGRIYSTHARAAHAPTDTHACSHALAFGQLHRERNMKTYR